MSTYEEILASNKNDDHEHADHLRFVSRPILGGDLNTVTHAGFYHDLKEWQDYEMKKEHKNVSSLPSLSTVVNQWQDEEVASLIQSQQSTVYVEAPFIKQFKTIPGLGDLL